MKDFDRDDTREAIEWISKFWRTASERKKAEALITIHESMPNVIRYPAKEYICNSCGTTEILGPRSFKDNEILASDKKDGTWVIKQMLNDQVQTEAYCPECNTYEEPDRDYDSEMIEMMLDEMARRDMGRREGFDRDPDDDKFDMNLE